MKGIQFDLIGEYPNYDATGSIQEWTVGERVDEFIVLFDVQQSLKGEGKETFILKFTDDSVIRDDFGKPLSNPSTSIPSVY